MRNQFLFSNKPEIVISISRNGLLKACARFIIERSEIRKEQHAFKSVYFECRMVLFTRYIMGGRSTLVDFFSATEIDFGGIAHVKVGVIAHQKI